MTLHEFVDAALVAAAWVFWLVAAALFVRWPGLMTGGFVGVVLWALVGPWATWTAFGVTVVGATLWKIARPSWRGLFDHPQWATWAVAVWAFVLSENQPRLRLAGLVVMAAMSGWLVRDLRRAIPRLGRRYLRAEPALVVAGPDYEAEAVASGPVAYHRSAEVVRSGPCPICEGVLVASVRATDVLGRVDVAGVIARAACPDCGCRLVGVLDPARPTSGLLWFEAPTPGPLNERQAG